MAIIKRKIEVGKVDHFIEEAKGLQNFWFATHEDDITNLYFSATVRDISKDYSKYEDIAVSHRSGNVHMVKF